MTERWLGPRTRCSGGGVTRTTYYGCCVGFSIGDEQHGGHSQHRLGNPAWSFLDALDRNIEWLYRFFVAINDEIGMINNYVASW
ncbi:hypothetical protein E2C01_007454 [Portunus trituberculatus]|uniref:Uncharacterized protein n=1 Tax=Portunus trituberculatus TaxID=210409 RepID=A0A5B7D4A6_PORTR|nr:hypothetical protein [Portunus trituberculatus]